MNEKTNTGLFRRTIGLVRDKILQKDRIRTLPDELQSAYKSFLPQIEDLYGIKTFLWHGSERYQYKDGKTIDVLDQIINDNGLIPNKDPYDSMTGIGNTTSFALSRMYARMYSDMYLDERKKPSYEYGSRLFWATKFIGETVIKGVGEAARDIGFKKIAKDPKDFITRLKNNNRGWISKFRSDAFTDPKPISKIFSTLQTDIAGNYPILIGVTQDGFTPVPTSKYIGKHEKRTKDSIPLKKFTHIEVPLEKVAEVKRLLQEKEIELPVIPIEVGEQYCSQFPYQTIVNGGYLKK